MNTTKRDIRGGRATKLVRTGGDITAPVGGGWTTAWQNLHADMVGLVQTDGGLLVCAASFRAKLGSAPQYQVFFRWLIDGVAPDTTDAHAGIVNYSATPITNQLWPVTCRAALVVGPGLHRVSLQGRSDVAAVAASVAASAAEPLVAVVDCR